MDIRKEEWINHWSGKWGLITCSYTAYQYDELMSRLYGKGFGNFFVYVQRKGISSCYLNARQLKEFGEHIRKIVNEEKIRKWCKDLKKVTDQIVESIENNDIVAFWRLFEEYGPRQQIIKKSIDYLREDELKRFMSIMEDARKYSEKVFTLTEKFILKIGKRIGNEKLFNSMLRKEVIEYEKKGIVPNGLERRYEYSVLIYKEGKEELFLGKHGEEIEKALVPRDRLSGIPAYKGRVKGIVKIIIDPKKESHKFNNGDILVTGMTRPEFLPLFKKASAVITDAGGLLCHAAITARELKIPCIVGTQNATKILKDGMVVIVDNGRIEILHQ